MSDVPDAVKRLAAPAQDAAEYWVDAWQRGTLFLDVLRQRGDLYIDHMHAGKPPVLTFDYELVASGRDLPAPANYALARIIAPPGLPAMDPKKRPFVVIDPRAGHGPGIGGFKMDSEIGIALQQGHPCYFVFFYPRPEPGQTIERVARAEAAFLERVAELHPDAEGQPFVIGNCQGGWALMILAASEPERVGPILLAGSPISYWAGVEGKNPMRYSGGMLGGTWLASLAGDLGNGTFDGAYLVNNFEQMNPANTYWKKLYNVYSHIDTEPPRFLEFERWWGGHFLMNKEEMEWITQNLFVGNRLSAGEVVSANGEIRIDLRNIRSPIIVFASWGDDITPPQQALNWIPDLYDSVEAIRLHEQTIVYCLNEKIGHLGIFVSAGVAKKEHAELISALDLIDTLPPGLYEAVIEDTRPDLPGLEFVEGRYLIRFEMREIEDILALGDGRDHERAFEVVERVAEINQGIYDTFLSPWVKALSNPWTARWNMHMNPARVERWLFSDLNPAMWGVKMLADTARQNRHAVSSDNALLAGEYAMSHAIGQGLDGYRAGRDSAVELIFKSIYGSPWLAALVGLKPASARRRALETNSWIEEEFKRLKRRELEATFEHGTLLDGAIRMLLYCGRDLHVVDERPFNAMRHMLRESGLDDRIRIAELKQVVKRQTFLVLWNEERALAGLARLLPTPADRRRALDVVRTLAATRGEIVPAQQARLDRVAEVLAIEPREKRVKSTQAS
ncbi:TerB family tellurite resistance protein [Caballeronia sp. DA-9]|uniref:TerB family tellurite resistance protein n=1 Tax=Caballeronia sp. DA-9 TaxID=3436237 RepID=UPI003F665CB2